MRGGSVFALGVFLCAGLGSGQQPAPGNATPTTPPTPPAAAPSTPQTIYYAGPGVTAPQLLPVTLTDAATGRCKHLNGTVVLSAFVDTSGVPQQVSLVLAAGNGLDQEALRLLKAERFKPGTRDGSPVAVAIETELDMKACVEEQKNDSGQKIDLIRLRSVPEQKLELSHAPIEGFTPPPGGASPAQVAVPNMSSPKAPGNISPPVPIRQPEAEYSDQARRDRISGYCLISLIVDAQGMPQNVHIIRSLEPSLDQKAIEAVSKYRFKPARKKDGTPVPVMITVEVAFHLYR